MKRLVNKIFELLNINGRDWVVLLLALLLAFSTWIIHKLSLEYSVYLNVNVVAHSNIEGHSDRSMTSSEIMAKCRTTGWQVLYAQMTRNRQVDLTLPANILIHGDGDRYYVLTEKLHEYVGDIYGSSVSVEYFVSDRIYFRFQDRAHKKVPVRPVYSFTYADQYVASGNLQIRPDSVTVYGDTFHLNSIDHVKTSLIRHTGIAGSLNGMVALEPISGMRISDDEVHYSMNVVRYVEIKVEDVPVEILNQPKGRTFSAVPPKVDVMMDCEFPLKSHPDEGIRLVVDYRDFLNSISGKVKVQAMELPAGAIRYEVQPLSVGLQEERK